MAGRRGVRRQAPLQAHCRYQEQADRCCGEDRRIDVRRVLYSRVEQDARLQGGRHSHRASRRRFIAVHRTRQGLRDLGHLHALRNQRLQTTGKGSLNEIRCQTREEHSQEDRGRGDLDIRLREVHRHLGGVLSGRGRRRGNPKVHGETGPLAGASCQEPSRKARNIRKETDEQKIHKGSDRFQSE